jgi:hypothetical protein
VIERRPAGARSSAAAARRKALLPVRSAIASSARATTNGIVVIDAGGSRCRSNQTGFLAFQRWDGQLVDAGTHPVKYLQMAAS